MTPFGNGKHFTLSEGQRFLLLAILIGIFSGLMVVAFHIAIDLLSWYSLGALSGTFRFGRLVSPALGALVRLPRHPRVSGGPRERRESDESRAVYLRRLCRPSSTVTGKFLACSIAIGSGNSLGPEDPSLQMGAGIASMLGRLFHLGRKTCA